jgi:integrase
MVLHMTRPTRRPDSSILQFRKRVPADIQKAAYGRTAVVSFPVGSTGEPAVTVNATLRGQAKFSLHTRDPATAKERTGIATAQLERLYSAIRNGPRPLTHKEVVALAGLIYRGFAEGGEDNPGSAETWERVIRANEAATDGTYGVAALMIGDDARYRAAMEERFGRFADGLLSSQGVVTDAASRERLIGELAKATTQAAVKLRANANSDYRPDPNADRFPPWEGASSPAKKDGVSATFDSLFESWRLGNSVAASTVTTWQSYVRALKKHLGHNDPSRVTKADILAWRDALLAAGYAHKGVRDGQLAAIRRLYAYALDNDLPLPGNPTHGVKVSVKRTAGTRMQPYSDAEVVRLLALADGSDAVTEPARYWLPWLLALTGARVGEVAQLWGSRITKVDGIPVMQISPAEDGGSLKNAISERVVPIHPALVDRGFLEFVRAKGSGPLFYGGARKTRKSPGQRHTSKGVANHLAAWIREHGFTDPRKAPNHAFRHWFKAACGKAGVLDSVADTLQGQTGGRGEADRYRHFDVPTLYRAIKKVRVPGPATSGRRAKRGRAEET